MASQGDRLFERGLKTLPAALKKAIVEAELDDTAVFQSFRHFSKDKLGFHVGGKRPHVVSEHSFALSAEGAADIKEIFTSAVGDASESKFHSGLANVLSGKKRRTEPKRRQAPRDEVVESGVESRAGETDSCDVSRHGTVPLVLESGGQDVASFPSFPMIAEIPVLGEMTSKGASDFLSVSGIEESMRFSTDVRDAKKSAAATECGSASQDTSKLCAHQMPPVGEGSAVPAARSSNASCRPEWSPAPSRRSSELSENSGKQ